MSENEKVLDQEGIIKLGRLARLEVGPEEAARLSSQLSEILGYVKQLDKFDVANIAATSHVHGSYNVFADDEVTQLMDSDTVKSIAPDSSGRFIRVPIIIDQEGGES